MKTKRSKIILISAGALLLLVTASAFTYMKSQAGRKEAAREIRKWVAENVTPVMKPQREKLDLALTAEERAQVNQLRSEFRSVISHRQKQGIGFFSASEEPLNATQQEQLAESRDQLRRILGKLWAIADLHEAEIHALLKPAADRKASWREDFRKILAKSLGKRYLVIADADIVTRIESRQLPEYFAPVVFLLWDPQHPFLTDDMLQ